MGKSLFQHKSGKLAQVLEADIRLWIISVRHKNQHHICDWLSKNPHSMHQN